jgi:hypothetical protein
MSRLDEKIKLTANSLDRASTACLAVGVIAPLAAAFYDLEPSGSGWKSLVLGALIWLLAAIALHYAARRALNGLPK